MNSFYSNHNTSINDIRNETTLIVGRRGTGKSHFIVRIYETLNIFEQFDHVYIIAPTEEMSPFYSIRIPDATIASALTDEIMDDLCTLSPNSLVILDDCYHQHLQPAIRSLIMLYVQNRITFIVTQRMNVSFMEFDNIFLGKELSVDWMKRSYRSINHELRFSLEIENPTEEPDHQLFDNFRHFRQCMEAMPLYSFMYIHQVPFHRFISTILQI